LVGRQLLENTGAFCLAMNSHYRYRNFARKELTLFIN